MPAADLRIEFNIEAAKGNLKIVPRSGRAIIAKGSVTTAELATLRGELRNELLNFVSRVGDALTPADSGLIAGLKVFHQFGASVIYQILGSSALAIQLQDVAQQISRAVAPFRYPIIEIVGEVEQVFPVEVLPIFGMVPPNEEKLRSLKAIVDFAGCFAGFSAIIKRILPDTPVSNRRTLNTSSKLGVKLLRHNGIAAGREICAFFRCRKEVEIIGGPWPDAPIGAGFDEAFCDHLWKVSQPPYGVVHIACHCITQQTPSQDYLLFAFDDSTAIVEIRAMQRQFIRLRQDFPPTGERPLVFLNACSGARLDPAKPSSLPRHLLREGYLGFIGTLTDVPDVLASDFSQCFYAHLLEESPLGEALLKTRRDLLWRRNPLGLIYTHYGNPDLRFQFNGS